MDELKTKEMISRISSETLGHRLRRARNRQGLSIRDLAEKAGVSKTSIVRIEQGHPSFPSTIVRIAGAMGLHLAGLTEPIADDQIVAVHHAEDDRWFDLVNFGEGPLGGLDRPTTVEERRGLADVAIMYMKNRLEGGVMLPVIVDIYAPSNPRSHPGEEMVYAIKGPVKLTIGHQTITLQTGESASFWSSEIHVYEPGEGADLPVQLLSVRVDYARS